MWDLGENPAQWRLSSFHSKLLKRMMFSLCSTCFPFSPSWSLRLEAREIFFKKLGHVTPLVKFLSGSYCCYRKSRVISPACRAVCDLPRLPADFSRASFLRFLWIQTWRRLRNSLSSGGHRLPNGLPIACTSIKPCFSGTLSRQPYSTPFPK